jgi:HK97 family phage prohead protease
MKPVRKFLSVTAPADSASAATSAEMAFRASDLTPDRYGDRVFVAGMKLDRYQQNPIMLFDHNHALPVASGKVWTQGTELYVSPTFTRSSAKGREVENLVDEGVIRTVSVGFLPLKTEPNEFGGLDYLESELLEISFVSVPANPNALRVKSMKSDEKKAAALLAKSFAAMLLKAALAQDPELDIQNPETDDEEHPSSCPSCGQPVGESAKAAPPTDAPAADDKTDKAAPPADVPAPDADDKKPAAKGAPSAEETDDDSAPADDSKPSPDDSESGNKSPTDDEEAKAKAFFEALLS